ncbi:MAG: zinc ribbon domain-containing protein [Muribaculaceae bacterium]|nr:zinc ribbon domain-containing protein [Muribaculaceae bacterium]
MAYNIFTLSKVSPSERDLKKIVAALKKEQTNLTGKRNRRMITPEQYTEINDFITQAIDRVQNEPSYITSQADEILQELKSEVCDFANTFVDKRTMEIDADALTAVERKFKSKGLSANDILNIIGAKVRTAAPVAKPVHDDGVKPLPKARMDAINSYLKKLGLLNIYQFLGIPADADHARFSQVLTTKTRADSVDVQRTPAKDVAHHLMSAIQDFISDQNLRKGYDKALREAGFDSVGEKMTMMASINRKFIAPDLYKELLDECTRNGLELALAQGLIAAKAQELGMQYDDGSVSATSKTCRFCGALNDRKAGHCRNCSMPLDITCPKCGAKSAPADMSCVRCGFSFTGMRRALQLVSDAESAVARKNLNIASQLAVQAEDLWPGYPAIKELMIKIKRTADSMPVPSPEAVTAKVTNKTISISWKAIPIEGAVYTVVRRESARPTSLKDGKVVGKTANLIIDDPTPAVGTEYYYGVFAEINGRMSATCGTTSVPAVIIQQLAPADIAMNVDESSVTFSWPPLKGLTGMEISRDGTAPATASGTTFRDPGLSKGNAYNYTLTPVFGDGHGGAVKGNPVRMRAMPQEKPKAVSLSLSEDNSHARLSWDTPKTGQVFIYRSSKPFKVNRNDVVSIDTFTAERLNVAGNSCTVPKDFTGLHYFIPVTVSGNIGVVGDGVKVSSVSALDSVQISRGQNGISLKWKWGASDQAKVEWSLDGGAVHSQKISRSGPTGFFNVSVPDGSGSVSVSVKSVADTSEGLLEGPCTEKSFTLKAMIINFDKVTQVKRFGFLKSNKYILSLSGPGGDLPCDLKVLVQDGFPPADLINHPASAIIKASALRSGKAEITVEPSEKGDDLYFRLVPVELSVSSQLTIVPEVNNP